MFDKVKDSVSAILQERMTSPFYGTFTISWLACNWEIWYLTFFINARDIPCTKIEYITQHHLDYWTLIVYPLVSTAIIITVLPFITNLAYWVNLRHRKIRKWLLTRVENATLEQH